MTNETQEMAQTQYGNDIVILKNSLPRIEKKIDKLSDTILGNGGVPGLKTDLEVAKQSLKRIWGTIMLSWLGLLVLLVVKSLVG